MSSSSSAAVTSLVCDPDVLSKPMDPATLHYVPATVDPASAGAHKVSTYFTPFIEKGQDGRMTASFRGRPLDGEVVSAPDGHKVVLAQAGREDGLGEEDRGRSMRVLEVGDAFTNWNYDRTPSDQDPLRKALKHIQLADVMMREEREPAKK